MRLMDDLGVITEPAGGSIVALLALVSGVGAAVILFETYRAIVRGRRLRVAREAPETLGDRLQELSVVSDYLRSLSVEVTAEAEAQAKAAELAAADARRDQQLATLTAEQAQAVNAIFEASNAKQQKALTKSTVVWAVISLVASNAVSVVVALWLADITR
ncbi:hypothetical protein IFU40_13580 [Microbacterium sp. CFBP 13617]|uniref:hypothetical protein n=1 Tax=Microbacterium sp. CFBP 13617 TaxID=2774035 RepID=UPI00177DCD59|nr:hypothetical protein [Microbacterium sp. CFBP 13617]MBD8219664.1 hypothetical protein [Microbacterium sp. CFBP 13617]